MHLQPSHAVTGHTDFGPRRPYQTPRLNQFGDVRSLTETGSRNSTEDSDGMANGMCNGNVNMIGNMC
jgi:hypothetical protein